MVRIQKWLSQNGISSRRKAEALVLEGRVLVNGELCLLGQKIDENQDKVSVDGKNVRPQISCADNSVYMLNKPRNFVCSKSDQEGESIFSLLPTSLQRKNLRIAGRLDKDSEGLVILTNNGELIQKISHPSYGIQKEYLVKLKTPFALEHKQQLLVGVEDQGEHLFVNKVHVKSIRSLKLVLTQGRKREIRRLLEALGYEVSRLKRICIGQLKLGRLSAGDFKVLIKREVALLTSPRKMI